MDLPTAHVHIPTYVGMVVPGFMFTGKFSSEMDVKLSLGSSKNMEA